MPQIRQHAQIDDVIIGMAGSGRDGLRRIHPQLIYWMQVDEALTFDQYWEDPRFARKKPLIPASKLRMVGDNTYRHAPGGRKWRFGKSMHFVPEETQEKVDPEKHPEHGGHVQTDTSVNRVLLSQRYTYWGGSGPAIPNHLLSLFPKARGYKCNHPEPGPVHELHQFVDLAVPRQLLGEPADWGNQRYFRKH